MENLRSILAEHSFFKGMSAGHIDILVGCAMNVRWNEGEFIFREGQDANHFYLIRHGRVNLEIFGPRRGPIIIQSMTEGDVLGWSWLIPPYHWHFDAKAVELTRALALDGACLRGKCEKDPSLGYELMKRFTHIMEQRLAATRLQLLDLYRPASEDRK